MLAVDVCSKETGEVLKSFDMPYFAEGKRYINGWIKAHDFEIIKNADGSVFSNGAIYVKKLEGGV